MKKLGRMLLCAVLVLPGATAAAEQSRGGEAPRREVELAPDSPDQLARDVREDPAYRRAVGLTAWMGYRANHVQAMLRKARAGEQLRRAECLDALLSEAHAVERLAERDRDAVVAALRRGDDTVVPGHIVRLVYLADRSRAIKRRAYRCGKPKPKPFAVSFD